MPRLLAVFDIFGNENRPNFFTQDKDPGHSQKQVDIFVSLVAEKNGKMTRNTDKHPQFFSPLKVAFLIKKIRKFSKKTTRRQVCRYTGSCEDRLVGTGTEGSFLGGQSWGGEVGFKISV